MYNTSNPLVKEFRLFVLWKLLEDYTSVKEHNLVVKNYINPQYKDLLEAVREILPHTERNQYTIYCRYKGDEFYQITNYFTMVTAFRLMEAHDSPLLYLIRKDIGEWPEPRNDLMDEPGDLEIILESCPDTRMFTEIHRGRTEHEIYPEESDTESRGKKDKGRRKSARRQSRRKSARRKSGKRQSTRRKSARRQSGRRQSGRRQSRRQSAKRHSKK